MKNSLAVIIPAYNEEGTIKKVIFGINKLGTPIVVNDGSKDDTLKIIKKLKIQYINWKNNRGYDESIHAGIRKAIKLNFKYIIIIDADGQHDPNQIKIFLNLLKKDYDLVLGIRPYTQRLSEKIFSLIFNILYNLKDPLCGFKGYKVSFLKSLKKINTYNSIGTEILLNALKKKKRIKQVNIKLKKRINKPRFGNFIIANIKIAYSLIKGVKLILE